MSRRYQLPQGTRAVSDTGHLTPPWHNYLTGLDEVSRRVMAEIAPLDAGASLADVIAKINEILAAAKAASLMKDS